MALFLAPTIRTDGHSNRLIIVFYFELAKFTTYNLTIPSRRCGINDKGINLHSNAFLSSLLKVNKNGPAVKIF